MDHTHYAHWLPVHLRDMVDLAETHPDVAAKFNAGHFTAKKTRHAFSSMALDQVSKVMEVLLDLLKNPSALRRWMVAGPGHRVPGKQLVATVREQVIAVSPYEDTTSLAPCNHEEADARMMLHAAAVMKCEHCIILIHTVDVDLEVLLVWI